MCNRLNILTNQRLEGTCIRSNDFYLFSIRGYVICHMIFFYQNIHNLHSHYKSKEQKYVKKQNRRYAKPLILNLLQSKSEHIFPKIIATMTWLAAHDHWYIPFVINMIRFMTFRLVYYKTNTTCVTWGVGYVHHSETHEFNPIFWAVCVALSLFYMHCFIYRCLSICLIFWSLCCLVLLSYIMVVVLPVLHPFTSAYLFIILQTYTTYNRYMYQHRVNEWTRIIRNKDIYI